MSWLPQTASLLVWFCSAEVLELTVASFQLEGQAGHCQRGLLYGGFNFHNQFAKVWVCWSSGHVVRFICSSRITNYSFPVSPLASSKEAGCVWGAEGRVCFQWHSVGRWQQGSNRTFPSFALCKDTGKSDQLQILLPTACWNSVIVMNEREPISVL